MFEFAIRHSSFAVALLSAAVAFAGDPSVALPPFVLTGRVVDYDCAGLKSAEVRVRKGSLLLARSAVGSFGEDTSANYSVAVPMSNKEVSTAAQFGDTLAVEVDTGAAVYSDTNFTVSAVSPGRALKLNLKAAVCTNGKGVADQYLRDIRWDLEDMGLSISDYDPNADYDGDGVSNYLEYLAGTDAFDSADAGGVAGRAAARNRRNRPHRRRRRLCRRTALCDPPRLGTRKMDPVRLGLRRVGDYPADRLRATCRRRPDLVDLER